MAWLHVHSGEAGPAPPTLAPKRGWPQTSLLSLASSLPSPWKGRTGAREHPGLGARVGDAGGETEEETGLM